MALHRSENVVKTPTGRGPNPSTITVRELWARSGGVCQYPGCGEILYRDIVTPWIPINLGEVAHNVASSTKGPRGDSELSLLLSDDPDNLLMLCRNHHKTADTLSSEYRETTLTQWKMRHESAVQSAAQLTRGEIAFPLIMHATQIGGHAVHVDNADVVRTLLEEGIVPAAQPYRVVLDTQGQTDDSEPYWASQINTIRDGLRLCRSQMSHDRTNAPLAVFALAEMPALMALGHALGDKSPLRIYQFTRDKGTWSFQAPDQEPPQFHYAIPDSIGKDGVALVVSLTTGVAIARVARALTGLDVPIIQFSTPRPSTELVHSSETIANFRRQFRQCLTDIEARTPRNAPIHIFPCMPASLAVALGCCIMPKVSNPIMVYDAKGRDGVFRQCVNLPLTLTTQNLLSTSAAR